MMFSERVLCFVFGLLIKGLPDILATYSDAPVCNNTMTCHGNCGYKQQNHRVRHHGAHLPQCECDQECPIYGDCCQDYYYYCQPSEKTGNITDAMSSFEITSQIPLSKDNPYFPVVAPIIVRRRIEVIRLWRYMRCTKLKRSHSTNGHVWMISRCPENFHTGHISEPSCQNPGNNPLLLSPVSFVLNVNILFKNALCARCHGVGMDNAIPWPVTVRCDKGKHLSTLASNATGTINDTVMSDMLYSSECEIVYESDMWQFVRNCTPPTVVSECPVATSDEPSDISKLRKLCHLYVNVVGDSSGKMYKNVHCAMCALREKYTAENMHCDFKGGEVQSPGMENANTPSEMWNTPTLQGGIRNHGTTTSPHNKGPQIASLQILFNFNDNGLSYTVGNQHYRVDETHKLCKPNEVYDTLTLSCTALFCSPDRYPVNGTCHLKDKDHIPAENQVFKSGPVHFFLECYVQSLPHSTSDDLEDMFQRAFIQRMGNFIASYSNVGIKFIDFIKEDIMAEENTTMNKSPFHDDSGAVSEEVAGLMSTTKLVLAFDTENPASLVLSACRNIFKLFPDELELKGWSMTSAYLRDYMEGEQLYCPPHQTLYDFNATLDTDRQLYDAVVNRTYFPVDNVPFVYQLHPFVATNSTVMIKGCLLDFGVFLECAFLRYNSSQYKVTNGTLSLLNSDLEFDENTYRLFGNYAYVCESNLTRDYIEQTRFYFFHYSHVQYYLTIITSSLSITFLLGTLVVYSLLPELRNVPGKVVMSLSGTLLVSQSLQLVLALPKGTLCVVVAAVAHMAWISTFFWMTIMTIDLVCTLRSDHLVTDTKSRRRKYCLYAVCAWVLPVLVCGCLVCLDHWKVCGIDISYGANGICWIGNSRASVYVFGLPLGACLLVILACFCATLYTIETRSKIHQASLSGRQDRQKLFIYGKLSLMSGLTWVFCFSAAYAKVSVLWDFQIVLNGLQGCYIFLGFVGKRRVLKLLRIKTLSKLSKPHSSTYTGSLSVYK